MVAGPKIIIKASKNAISRRVFFIVWSDALILGFGERLDSVIARNRITIQ